MKQIFLDTSYNNIHILLMDDFKIIDKAYLNDIVKISDEVNDLIQELLNRNNISLKDISEFYITKGPGSFTGVRVAITIVKTLILINKNLKVFSISTLLFQAGKKACISTIDAKGQKKYIGIYKNGEEIVKDQILDIETYNDIVVGFSEYEVKNDLKNLDFENNFIELRNLFEPVLDVYNFEPAYIKKFI